MPMAYYLQTPRSSQRKGLYEVLPSTYPVDDHTSSTNLSTRSLNYLRIPSTSHVLDPIEMATSIPFTAKVYLAIGSGYAEDPHFLGTFYHMRAYLIHLGIDIQVWLQGHIPDDGEGALFLDPDFSGDNQPVCTIPSQQFDVEDFPVH